MNSAADQHPLVCFRVYGTPVAQGSKNGFIQKGRVVMVESGGKRHKDWRATVKSEASNYMDVNKLDMILGPLYVDLQFFIEKPKSKPKWKVYPDVRPDLDKQCRSVLDSMTGTVYKDDSQVCELHLTKIYADSPGVLISLYKLEESH